MGAWRSWETLWWDALFIFLGVLGLEALLLFFYFSFFCLLLLLLTFGGPKKLWHGTGGVDDDWRFFNIRSDRAVLDRRGSCFALFLFVLVVVCRSVDILMFFNVFVDIVIDAGRT